MSAQVTQTALFRYTPPDLAHSAKRILLKPNLGYPVAAPVTVSLGVLDSVLKSLRDINPTAEILIVEGVCSSVNLSQIVAKHGVYSVLDDGMQILDADELEMIEYENLSPAIVRFKTMWAPKLLQEVDCRISLGTFKRTILKDEVLISASLKNLYGLFPRSHYKARSSNSRGQLHRPSVPLVLQDVYFTIGHLFDGAVIDADERLISRDWKPDKGETVKSDRIVWGNDLLEVDSLACETLGEEIPIYLKAIEKLRSRE